MTKVMAFIPPTLADPYPSCLFDKYTNKTEDPTYTMIGSINELNLETASGVVSKIKAYPHS